MALKIEEIEKQMRGNVDSCCHPEYWNIRNYAPDITSQYIKARRFEVTEEFIARVEREIGMGSAAWDVVHPEEICEAVLKVMWEEIEQ